MKNLYRLFTLAALAASSFLTVGCIEEVEPTDVASTEQLASNNSATEAYLWAMPAYLATFNVMGMAADDEYHYDYGVGSIMHVRDVMGEEYVVNPSYYDWYDSWENCEYLGPDYTAGRLVWQTYYKSILAANSLLKGVPEPKGDQVGYVAQGLTFRAGLYLDVARMYEFLPTNVISGTNIDGNDVTGLTLPIIRENTTEEEARNNPRASHHQMFAFIKGDLEKALGYFKESSGVKSSDLPSVYTANGILARLYLWHASYLAELCTDSAALVNGYYAKAAEYAAEAMKGGAPMSQDEWTNPSSGFNSANGAWLWGFSVAKENGAVQTGICNWTSWVSNETTYGYAAAGPMPLVSPVFYDRISDSDFRKLSWKAPEGSKLLSKLQYADAALGADLPEYASLKFRPGNGNVSDYNVGSAVSIPLMRVEEMYFIEAEALAQQGKLSEAEAALTSFMKAYRDKKYAVPAASSKEDLISEIIFQKMVEFWGEGINYYDYKRLNMSVTRCYQGTIFADAAQYNTVGRPAWMNWVIPISEINNNDGVRGWNSNDPSNCYTPGSLDAQAATRAASGYVSNRQAVKTVARPGMKKSPNHKN